MSEVVDRNIRIVEGVIQIDRRTPLFRATIHLKIEDASRADAPSITVADKELKDIAIGGESPPINFSIQFKPERQKQYELFVHIDVDGDGKISIGDYINMISYPISSFAFPLSFNVVVRKLD
jgi:uncharacterized lipoprotein YbaY